MRDEIERQPKFEAEVVEKPYKEKLSPQQEKFWRLYAAQEKKNITEAALQAGYSENSAYSQGQRLLKHVEISKRLKASEAAVSRKIQVTHDELTAKLKAWIDADVTEFLNLSPEEIKELPKDLRQLITGIKPTKYGYELKFVSKEKAIDMVARHIGYYDLDNSQKAAKINVQELSTDVLIAIAQAKRED